MKKSIGTIKADEFGLTYLTLRPEFLNESAHYRALVLEEMIDDALMFLNAARAELGEEAVEMVLVDPEEPKESEEPVEEISVNMTTRLFWDHVASVQDLAFAGDEFQSKTLACLGLLACGWVPGDPDPNGGGGPGGGEPVIPPDNVVYPQQWRRAS